MAFTEFYCQTTGSNVNAGSTTADAAAYTATNGGWNSGTGVFTPASGDPSASVAVGDWASVYIDGATVAVFIGRVTAVSSTTVTVSTTAKSGTAPSTNATARTIKVGGAWKGPNAASGFPLSLPLAGGMTNAAGNFPRCNLKSGANYAITAPISAGSGQGGVTYQGYTTSPGDGGKAIIDGGTAGASFALLAIAGGANAYVDLIMQNNGATGSAAACTIGASGSLVSRCVAHDVRGNGFTVNTGSVVVECEAYACNQSNTASSGGFQVIGVSNLTRCISHDNTGSNAVGFYVGADGSVVSNCIADTNGAQGFLLVFSATLLNCDAYSNGADGISLTNTAGDGFVIENCSLIKNTGWGINGSGAGTRIGHVRNCGFGSGTAENTSGTTTGLKGIQEAGSVTYGSNLTPWVDPANGDFRISLAAAINAGRGEYLQTAASYAGTVGYPDIGASQHLEAGAAGGALLRSVSQSGGLV